MGSIRVVPDSPLGLPLEECFPLDGFRTGKRLAELCRLAVAAVVSHEVVAYLCGLNELVWVPRYIELDLLRRTMRVRRATSAGFYASIVRCRLAALLAR